LYGIYSVAAVLYLQSVLHVMLFVRYIQCCSCSVFTVCATCNVISPMKYVLYFYISTCHSVYAVPNMAVFCTSLITCFPHVLLRYCLSDFEMVPIAPIITSIILLSHSTCAEFLL